MDTNNIKSTSQEQTAAARALPAPGETSPLNDGQGEQIASGHVTLGAPADLAAENAVLRAQVETLRLELEEIAAEKLQASEDEKEIRRRMEIGLTREQAAAAIKRNREDKQKHQPLRDARRAAQLKRAGFDPSTDVAPFVTSDSVQRIAVAFAALHTAAK